MRHAASLSWRRASTCLGIATIISFGSVPAAFSQSSLSDERIGPADFELEPVRSIDTPTFSGGYITGLNESSPELLGNASRGDDWLQLRILPPSGQPLDSNTRARWLAGYRSDNEENLTEIDIRIGGENGLSLRSSFGVSSQPLNPSADNFQLFPRLRNRENRAMGNIGIRF
ncbi:MAG: hypothetical protein ACTS1Z_06295 [Parasphingopyxis sp.]|uniref:hypothetical protein n=1 Tax=Parasphingopyxis sp. TaxID=1920299 RepID=UPI003F9F682F